MPLTAPLLRTTSSWGLGQAHRKVSLVCHENSVEVKQALVEQGMYREQENSHLELPDYISSINNI